MFKTKDGKFNLKQDFLLDTMTIQDETELLKQLISKKSLDEFSGDHKTAIKLVICAIFMNIIMGRHFSEPQNINLNKLVQLFALPSQKLDSKSLINELRPIVESSLTSGGFIPPYDNIFLNRILTLFRNNIQNLLDNDISFIQASDFDSILDLERLFGCPIKPYQWLDFRLSMHITPNYPDMILFSDLKVVWNIYLEKRNTQQSLKNPHNRKEMFEHIVDQQRRGLDYTVSGLQRNLKFLIVSFVEAYLNSVYSNILYEHITNQNPKETVLKLDKINDIGIIEKIIFKHFPNIKSDTLIQSQMTKYKQFIKERDRYVHAISIDSGQITGFEPILHIDHTDVIDSLQTGIDIVHGIENRLKTEFKGLFWWYDGVISFKDEKPLSLIKQQSQYEQISYYH